MKGYMLPANACGNCRGLREVELGEKTHGNRIGLSGIVTNR
jgi:hypothetical protein